ncbi:UBA2 [Hepatospora eriocheir]|uniref:NEDD8-activating enzyme E1 catalytic subunit n=1 Tax=Hepatospora eriocheir TaxID=1081669 RepID=A0A1X0QG18_9MICR|nr:UBA2 [Hepatospora eriocheir]
MKNKVLNKDKIYALVVGSGGIGSELVKILNLLDKDKIDIKLVDYDTIDYTNLNRQFFFVRKDVDKYKCEVVSSKLRINCEPITRKICKETEVDFNFFSTNFLKEFDVVFNCLDNNETRSYVNQKCVMNGIPLIDGGSGGYFGQSYFFDKNTGCFDCKPKSEGEFYPVCTTRQKPEKFEHCLIWAKKKLSNTEPDKYKSEKIYNLACKKAKMFKLKISMNNIEASTFLNKIIPSICTTNSIIASLMVSSFITKYSYYLSREIMPVYPYSKNDECNVCNLPTYIFYKNINNKENIWEILVKKWNANSIIIQDHNFIETDFINNEICLFNYGIVNKNGNINRIYFTKFEDGNVPFLIKRVKYFFVINFLNNGF